MALALLPLLAGKARVKLQLEAGYLHLISGPHLVGQPGTGQFGSRVGLKLDPWTSA